MATLASSKTSTSGEVEAAVEVAEEVHQVGLGAVAAVVLEVVRLLHKVAILLLRALAHYGCPDQVLLAVSPDRLRRHCPQPFSNCTTKLTMRLSIRLALLAEDRQRRMQAA